MVLNASKVLKICHLKDIYIYIYKKKKKKKKKKKNTYPDMSIS